MEILKNSPMIEMKRRSKTPVVKTPGGLFFFQASLCSAHIIGKVERGYACDVSLIFRVFLMNSFNFVLCMLVPNISQSLISICINWVFF